MSTWSRHKGFWLGAGALLIILLSLMVWLFFTQLVEYTDDAYVEGNQVSITPLVPGFVQAIHTDDTFLVMEGQSLVELDRTDAEIALQDAMEELGRVVREVCQAFHQVFAYRAEIESKKADLIRVAQDFKHRADLLPSEAVSLEDFEHAVAALRAGYFSLRQTDALYDKAFAFIQNSSIASHPAVRSAIERVRYAWVYRHRCTLYAPVEGLTAQRTIQVGMWVDAGTPLMSLIPLDQIWVNANFKETQLKHMRIGQRARIRSDLYGSLVEYTGKIVGLPAAAGNAFSLLPPQNLSGNWIKIVQRLPVRIALDPDQMKEHPLRLGLSLEVFVDILDREGLLVPTTSKGAPVYKTSIFKNEEEGVHEAVEKTLRDNLDPLLVSYLEDPLVLTKPTLGRPMEEYLHSLGFEEGMGSFLHHVSSP